jgi:hypothetical protein
VANACLETSALFPEDKKTGVVVELKRRSHPVELSIVPIRMIAVELRQSHVNLSKERRELILRITVPNRISLD